jgi:hypothetical protein
LFENELQNNEKNEGWKNLIEEKNSRWKFKVKIQGEIDWKKEEKIEMKFEENSIIYSILEKHSNWKRRLKKRGKNEILFSILQKNIERKRKFQMKDSKELKIPRKIWKKRGKMFDSNESNNWFDWFWRVEKRGKIQNEFSFKIQIFKINRLKSKQINKYKK